MGLKDKKEIYIMEYLVLADFKTNAGMSDDMAAIFKEALVQTRAFDGCNAIDVYFEEKTTTFTLVEDWASLEPVSYTHLRAHET